MAFELYWRLSTADPLDRRRGDWTPGERQWAPGRDADSRDRQFNRYDYLAQVARAAELTGFDGVLVPDEDDGEEPWIVAAALIRETRRLKLVATSEPGSASAVYRAKMAASFQRFSAGRLALAIDLERSAASRAGEGDFVSQDDLSDRAEEMLALTAGIWGDGPYDQEGRFFVVEKGGLAGLVANVPSPDVWIRGAGSAAAELVAESGDVHLLPPSPIDGLEATIRRLRDSQDASVRIAAEIPILTRALDADIAAERGRRPISPHTLIGSYDAVADTLASLAQAGLDIAVLSAADQIRDVHIAGEQIVSRVRRRLGTPALAA
jgi:alkanesulfonate monooxygenase